MKRNGFTLIELAVTAIIIGILVLIAVPNLLTSSKRGYSLDAMRNLRTIYAAARTYADKEQLLGGYSGVTCYSDESASSPKCMSMLGLNIVSNSGTQYYCEAGICYAGKSGFLSSMKVNLSKPLTNDNIPMYGNGTYLDHNPYCMLGEAFTCS